MTFLPSKCLPALAGLCFALMIGPALADTDLLNKVDAARAPTGGFTFKATVTGPDNDRLKLSVRVKDGVKSLVRYIDPPRSRGRSLLFVEHNMWVYVPGTRKVLRISPQQRVLGGVASADIARMVYSRDYHLDGVEELPASGAERRQRLNLSRKSKGAAYARIALIVGGEEVRPLQAEFFASSGNRRLKTAYFEDYRDVLGRLRPTVLRVVNHVNGDRESILAYSDFTREDTPDIWFQSTYLKRLR